MSVASQTVQAPLGMPARISDAISRLMTTREDGETFRVSVPVLYPSGSGCSVEITPNGDSVFVSDLGLGHFEAEFAGASEHYDKQAKRAAGRFGVSYDGYSVFALRIPLGRLEGAIAAISNASVQAAGLAIMKAIEDKERRSNDEVFDRVKGIFGASLVAKSADVRGQRDTWNAHNVVTFPTGQRAVFEFVTRHQGSISNKFFMFSDLSGAPGGLSLNAVTKDIGELGSRGAMLSDVSNLIELSAANDRFEHYARQVVAA